MMTWLAKMYRSWADCKYFCDGIRINLVKWVDANNPLFFFADAATENID